MNDYSRYDIDINSLKDAFPDYLKTPGSLVMNHTQLMYDIINNYKNHFVDVWQHLSLDNLESDYLVWRQANPTLDDSVWKYTDLIEKLCKTYDIIREHPVGLLQNKHMIRLLKIKIMGVGFDGTREKLETILDSLFGQASPVRFLVQTRHQNNDGTQAHGAANVYVIKSDNDVSFDETDEKLFSGGYYFLELLGITLFFDVIRLEALIYDYTKYDPTPKGENKRYDEGVTE